MQVVRQEEFFLQKLSLRLKINPPTQNAITWWVISIAAPELKYF
tara:strand:+ start:346 stop:477 length:132 start_codon:yes stop_codon:yes gene_type:complete